MSATSCVCNTIGAPRGIRFCEEHHKYWDGDRRLASVTQVIRQTWPLKPDFAAASPEVLEHARERGIRVDRYFAQYLTDGRLRIPAGEWLDVVSLTGMLIQWWNRQPFAQARWQCQYLTHDSEVAGTADLFSPEAGLLLDLKTTFKLEPVYGLQVAAYAEIERFTGRFGVIHLNKNGVRLQMYGGEERQDWTVLRDMWRVVRRRAEVNDEN